MMFGPSFTTPGECLLYFFRIFVDYRWAFIALAGAAICCKKYQAPLVLFRLWKIFFALKGVGICFGIITRSCFGPFITEDDYWLYFFRAIVAFTLLYALEQGVRKTLKNKKFSPLHNLILFVESFAVFIPMVFLFYL